MKIYVNAVLVGFNILTKCINAVYIGFSSIFLSGKSKESISNQFS